MTRTSSALAITMTAPTATEHKVRAFLDTNVIIAYAKGQHDATELFSSRVLARTRLLINPVVLQELLLAVDLDRYPELAPRLELLTELLPLDAIDSQGLLKRVRDMRNRAVHANEFLIYSSAKDCDYLVTYDKDFQAFRSDVPPQIVTPTEFLHALDSQG